MIDNSLPIGSIVPYGGEVLSSEVWKLCDGSSLSTTDYSELFAKIGYKFGGSGNLFKLPNQAEASFIGYSASGDIAKILGSTVGENNHTLSQTELPATLGMHASILGTSIGHGTVNTVSGSGTQALIASTEGDEIALTNTGGGQAVSLVNKSIVVNYIIKVKSESSVAPTSLFNGTAQQIESKANKVTTISSSSTDTQYPTAKAVYDYIQTLLAND